MKKSLSYRKATNQDGAGPSLLPDIIAEDDEQETVVYRKPRAIGGGVNSIKSRTKPKPSLRRISCVDLGVGTYEGWLYTKKPRKKQWEKCSKWCVLKNTDLYVYVDKMDTVATSRICLPAFTVSEAKETRKEGAFKVHNEGTTFYFRCKTEKEKHVWMNYLSLAAIEYEPAANPVSGSSASSSGIDVNSGYSSRTSHAYSDSDDTESSSICDESVNSVVAIRPKKSSIHAPGRLKSHIDTNLALRHLVTSIRDADLDLIGNDSDTRRQSQLRKSLASAGFTRKNSTLNRKVFQLRSKERQKQALEHELADIETLLGNTSQSNLYDFLSRYPDYQDSMVSSTDSSTIIMRAGRNHPHTCMSDDDMVDKGYDDNRQTLTPDFENFRLCSQGITDAGRSSASSSNHSSSGSNTIFTRQKYKQTVTHL